MEDNRKKKQREALERKQYIRTNYGPEETDYTYIINHQNKVKDMNELQAALKQQVSYTSLVS